MRLNVSCLFTHEFVQTYKVCLRVTQPSGGSFPLAVFCCVKKHIRMYKLLNPDAVLIPRKPV